MDDQKYIKVNGVIIPAPLDDSEFEDTSVEEISSNLPSFKPGSLGRNMYTVDNDVVDIAKKYNIDLKRNMQKQELDKYIANAQSWREQLGRALGQLVVNEVAIGTVLGFSDLADYMINIGKAYGEDDWTNPVSSQLTEWQDKLKEYWKIYRENPDKTFDVSDAGWWFDNSVQIGSTLSLMIPAAGTVRALGAVSKLTKFDRALNKVSYGLGKVVNRLDRGIRGADKAKSAFTYARGTQLFGRDAGRAVISRQMEDMLEGREVYKETKENALKEFSNMTDKERELFLLRNPELIGKSDEEMAEYIADKAAQNTFEDDFAFVLTDFLSWKAIGSGYMAKAGSRKLNQQALETLNRIANGAGVSGENTMLKHSVRQAERSWFRYYLDNPSLTAGKVLAGLELNEGIEEFGQGLVQERSKEIGYEYFDPKYSRRAMASYLGDEKLWEQAFWGAIGGMAFGAAHKGYTKIKNKIELAKIKSDAEKGKGNLTSEDINNLSLDEEERRANNIGSWAQQFMQLKAKMDLFKEGYNPYTYVPETDDAGITTYREAKEGEYEKLTEENKELIGNKIIDEFVSAIAYQAVDNGNIDYLKALISDPIFNESIKAAAGENAISDDIENRMKEQLNKAVGYYDQALYDIFMNGNTESESVGRAVARVIAKSKFRIDQLNERIQGLNDKISNQIDGKIDDKGENISDNYYRKALQEQIFDELNYINRITNIINSNIDNKINGIEGTNVTYKKHKLDELRRERNQLLKRLQETLPYTEFKTDKNGNLIKDKEGNYISEVIDLISKSNLGDELTDEEYNKLIDQINVYKKDDFGNTTVTPETKKLVDKKIKLELQLDKFESIVPKNKNEIQEAIDDMEAAFGDIISNRLNKTLDDIVNYITKSENPEETYINLLNGTAEDKKIQEKFNYFKIGDNSYATYQEMFKKAAQTKKEQQEATRTETETAQTSSTQQTGTASNVTTNQTSEESNNNDENNEDEINWEGEFNDEIPSTGEAVDDDNNIDWTIDGIEIPKEESEIDWEDYNDMDYYADDSFSDVKIDIEIQVSRMVREYYFSLNPIDQAKFISNGKNEIHRSLFRQGFYTVGTKLKNEIQGMREKDISHAIHEGIILGIKSIQNTIDKTNTETSKSISNALKELYVKLNGSKYDNDGNLVENEEFVNSDRIGKNNFINEAIEEFLTEYIQLRGNVKTASGKYTIDILSFFSYLSEQDLDTIKKLYNTFNNFFKTYKGDKYFIPNKRYLKDYENEPNQFFEKVLLEQSEKTAVDSQNDRIGITKNNYFHAIRPSVVRNALRELDALKKSAKRVQNELDEFDYTEDDKRRFEELNEIIDKYNDNVRALNNGAKAIFIYNEKSKSLSIRVVKNGQNIENVKNDPSTEIAYMGSVTANSTNTTYMLESDNQIGIGFIVSRNNNILTSNADPLFKELTTVLEGDTSNKDATEFVNLLLELQNLSYKERNKLYEKSKDKLLNYLNKYKDIIIGLNNEKEQDKVLYRVIFDQIMPILFYNGGETGGEYYLSYKQYIARVYNNYRTTQQIQNALKDGKLVVANLTNAGYNIVQQREEHNIIDDYEHTSKKPRMIYVSKEGSFIFANSQESTRNFSGTKAYNIGFAVTNNSVGNGIAWVSGQNKLSSNKKLASKIEDTIYNLLLGQLGNTNGINVSYLMQHFQWLFGDSTLFYGVSKTTLKNELNKLRITIDAEEANKIARKFAQNIVNVLKFNKSYWFASNIEKNSAFNNNPYYYFENGKLTIKLKQGAEDVIYKYNDYADFAFRENAFKTREVASTARYGNETVDDRNDLYFSANIMDDFTTSPVEGTDIETNKTITERIKKLSPSEPIFADELLAAVGFEKDDIDFVLGRKTDTVGTQVPLIPTQIYYNSSSKVAKEGFAYYDKEDKRIYLTSSGRTKIKNGLHREEVYRFLLHENIHKHFDELDEIDKKYIIKEVNKIIKEYLDYLINDTSEEAETIKKVFFEKIDKNGNEKLHKLSIKSLTDYFNRLDNNKVSEEEQMGLVSEWLAESLSQNGLIEYLSKIEAKDYKNNSNEEKTLFQKLIDAILKFFGISQDAVNNNSIFAKQYELFSKNKRNIKIDEENTLTPPKITENKDGETNNDVVEETNEETEEEKRKKERQRRIEEQKRELKELESEENDEYEDTLFISTKRIGNYIERRVNNSDVNISGIQNITDMNSFLEIFSSDERLKIAKMIKNGDLLFACK